MTRLERVNSTVVSGNPKTTADVAAPPKRGTIHGEDRSLTAGRTAWCVVWAVWVSGDSPYGISTFKREECLGYVCLDERYAACFSDECNKLCYWDAIPL